MSHFPNKRIHLTLFRQTRIYALCILTALTAWSAAAETALNPFARLAAHKSVRHTRNISIRSANQEAPAFTPVILKTDDENAILPDYVHELHRRGNIVLANVDIEHLGDLSQWPSVSRIEANIASLPSLDKAKEFCNLSAMHNSGLYPSPLTGEGVVTGFCDTGFDPSHINFLDSEGNSRVKKIVNYTLSRADAEVLDTPGQISAWGTDNHDETHATHVAGIMSGSFSADNLQGIATEADIVATTSPLYDAYLLDGCEHIIEYAAAQNKPAVINMSISSATGPHDGTTLFNQYMEQIAGDATVCIAAGNSGNRPGYIRRVTTESNPVFRTYTREWTNINPLLSDGAIDIWSATDETFSVSIIGRNMFTGEISYRWTYDITPNSESAYPEMVICSPDLAGDFPSHAETLLPERLSGYIYVTSELNPENHRFNTMCYFSFKDITTDDPYAAEWAMGVEVTGHDNQEIQLFSTRGIYLVSYHDPIGVEGDTQRNVNDFCLGEGPVCVGSMDSRESCQLISGQTLANNRLHAGGPSYFSSYGTFDNGISLPHICAPGALVISSLSTHFITQHPEQADAASLARQEGETTYYWGADQGTSMSSPFVAGTFALWLQANPNLTPDEIKQIAIETASSPTTDPDDPKWGHGMLDAEAGLKKALSHAGIDSDTRIDSTSQDLTVRPISTDSFMLYCGGKTIRRVAVYNIAGVKVMEIFPSDISAELRCGHLGKAVYIVEAEDNAGACHSAKISVR